MAVQARLDATPAALLPRAFFDTFEHTTTGSNFTHPRLWGIIAAAAASLPRVAVPEIDVRLNEDRGKFQPDLLLRGYDRAELLYVDLESPNSSDARLSPKDVAAWQAFAAKDRPVPYLIFTVLPDAWRLRSEWPLRYSGEDYYNANHAKQGALIRLSPYRYWYQQLVSQHPEILGVESAVTCANFSHDGARATVARVDLAALPASGEHPEWLGLTMASHAAGALDSSGSRDSREAAAREVAQAIVTGLTGSCGRTFVEGSHGGRYVSAKLPYRGWVWVWWKDGTPGVWVGVSALKKGGGERLTGQQAIDEGQLRAAVRAVWLAEG